jgi:hypothetical protein
VARIEETLYETESVQLKMEPSYKLLCYIATNDPPLCSTQSQKSGANPGNTMKVKGEAIPLQSRTGPEGSRRLRFPDFKTIGTLRW